MNYSANIIADKRTYITVLLYAREVAKLKENLRAEVREKLKDIAESEIDACFELEFFRLMNNLISEVEKDVDELID